MIAGFDLAWDGEGTETRGIDRNSSRTVVDIDARFSRPIDSNIGPGDASKAQAQLGWKPRASFQELVELMMQADLDSIS
jgi:GDPmannose 4,6-dehydratase